MYSSGTWELKGITDAATFNWDIMEYPNMKPGIPKAYYIGDLITIVIGSEAEADVSEALYEFIDYAITPEQQLRQVVEFKNLPAGLVSAEDLAGTDVDPRVLKIIERLRQTIELQLPATIVSDGWTQPDTHTAIRKAGLLVVMGELSPEEAAARVQKSIESVRAQWAKVLEGSQ